MDPESRDGGLPDTASCDEAPSKAVEPSSACIQEVVEEESTRAGICEGANEEVEQAEAIRIAQNPPISHEEPEPLKKRGLSGLLKSIFGR